MAPAVRGVSLRCRSQACPDYSLDALVDALLARETLGEREILEETGLPPAPALQTGTVPATGHRDRARRSSVGSRRYFFVSGGPAYVQLPIRQPSASFRNANVICAAAWTGTPRDLIEYVTFSTT